MLELRNQELTDLNRSADFLGRTLRENVELHSMDSANSQAKFITESGKLISTSYATTPEGDTQFTDVVVEDVETITSDDYVDSVVSENIHKFIRDIRADEYNTAEVRFTDVLQSFEDRSKVVNAREKFQMVQERFSDSMNITNTSQWKKLNEVSNLLTSFLAENQESVTKMKDISNGIKLCTSVHKAFNAPVQSLEEVVSESSFTVPSDSNKTLYDMLCQQELIRKEILESKANFAQSWAGNEAVQHLANCIYSKPEVIAEGLEDAIREIPYLALATKAELTDVFESVFKITSDEVITKKDVREFVHCVFESKKAAKSELLSVLSEKYGLNIQSLKFVPSFSGLAKAQSVVFEVLSKATRKEGVLHDVLVEFSSFLRKKGGVHVLEVNDFLTESFSNAGYSLVENGIMAQYINVPKLKADLQALKILVGGGDAAPEGAMGDAGAEMEPGVEPDPEAVGKNPVAEPGVAPEEAPQGPDTMTDELPPEAAGDEMPGEMDAEMPPEGLGDDSEAAQAGGMDMEGGAPEEMGGGGDAASLVADLEALIASLAGGGGGMDDMEGGAPPEEGFQKSDAVPGEEAPAEEEGGAEEGGAPPENGEANGMPPKADGKKPFPPKKKKPFPPQ